MKDKRFYIFVLVYICDVFVFALLFIQVFFLFLCCIFRVHFVHFPTKISYGKDSVSALLILKIFFFSEISSDSYGLHIGDFDYAKNSAKI